MTSKAVRTKTHSFARLEDSERAARRRRLAFEAVANPTDWRAPIDAVIDIDDLDLTTDAIHYYTGCEVITTPVEYNDSGTVSKVQIDAAGYRFGPAGP